MGLASIDTCRNTSTLRPATHHFFTEEANPLRNSRTVSKLLPQIPLSCSIFWETFVSRRALLRAQLLRQTAQSSPIPPSHFTALTDHLTHAFTKGDYLKVDPSKPVERDEDGNRVAPPAMSSLSDPAMMEGMMGGMKNQFVTMVPQMLIMGWVNFFFSGFVLSAFPHLFLNHNPRVGFYSLMGFKNATGILTFVMVSSQTSLPTYSWLQADAPTRY